MNDKDSKLLWEAYNEGVEANTPPRNKKNRGDFLPKHVRDKINTKHDGGKTERINLKNGEYVEVPAEDEEDDEDNKGLEEDARGGQLSVMGNRTSGGGDNQPQITPSSEVEQPNGWTDQGHEELSVKELQQLSLEDLVQMILELDANVAPETKQTEDYKEVIYYLKRSLAYNVEELREKQPGYAGA
jgi:hypothetical protein